MVNDTIVKGKYKYAEGTPVRTHKVRLVNDCHLFPNSVSRATVMIQTDDIHPVVVQGEEEWTLFSTKHLINARGC